MITNSENVILELSQLITDRLPRTQLAVAMLSGSATDRSVAPGDIDITTVHIPENPRVIDSPLHLIPISLAMLDIGNRLKQEAGITSIFFASDLLQEAMVALASLVHPGELIIPIHWLHFTSPQFMAANEPQNLTTNLLSGNPLIGNQEDITRIIQETNPLSFSHLKGMHHLIGNFRVLICNFRPGHNERQTTFNSFLINQSLRSLISFWRQKILEPIALQSKIDTKGLNWQKRIEIALQLRTDLAPIFSTAQEMLKSSSHPPQDFGDVVDLHVKTFELWPLS